MGVSGRSGWESECGGGVGGAWGVGVWVGAVRGEWRAWACVGGCACGVSGWVRVRGV